MKKQIFELKPLLLLFFFVFLFPGLKSQTQPYQESFISIKKTKTFPVSNPAPQYTVEIRNDRSISFYNNLPKAAFLEHPAGLDKWAVDSTTILLDSADFKLLKETINEIDLENLDKIEKSEPENGIEIHSAGGVSDNFIIDFTNRKIEFGFGPYNEQYISESAKKIRNLIEELEEKYKPRK